MTAALVCTPLLVEWLALRGALTGAPTHTGLGPDRSRRSADRLTVGRPAVLVAGVTGGLREGILPGDIVVADEVRGNGTSRLVSSAPMLAAELRDLGLRVHVGPIVSSGRAVLGAARAELAATGLAVDMESSELSVIPTCGAFAVVRVVVDTVDRPLISPGTIPRGYHALRILREAAPAIEAWVRAIAERVIEFADPPSADAVDDIDQSLGLPAGGSPESAGSSDAAHIDEMLAVSDLERPAVVLAKRCDLVLVLGRPGTYGPGRLVEVVSMTGTAAHLVGEAGDIKLGWLTGVRRIGIVSDCSASDTLRDDVVHAVSGLGAVTTTKTPIVRDSAGMFDSRR